MNEKEVVLCAPYTTFVSIDCRDEDVSVEVGPAMLFNAPLVPGRVISPEMYVPGIALRVEKGRSLSIKLLMTDEQALEHLKAVSAAVVRTVTGRLDEALEMVKEGMENALKDPAAGPGCEARIQGGEDAPIESVEGRRDGDLSGCEEDEPH